jgi:hypothetical protein
MKKILTLTIAVIMVSAVSCSKKSTVKTDVPADAETTAAQTIPAEATQPAEQTPVAQASTQTAATNMKSLGASSSGLGH